MKIEYNDFANKVLFWPLLKAGHNTLPVSLDKFVETIYEEAKYLLVYSAVNNRHVTFDMVCVRLNEVKFEDILDKSPEMYERMNRAKADLFKEIEKRRKENKHFEEYWQNSILCKEK
jgi:hypothetical protein